MKRKRDFEEGEPSQDLLSEDKASQDAEEKELQGIIQAMYGDPTLGEYLPTVEDLRAQRAYERKLAESKQSQDWMQSNASYQLAYEAGIRAGIEEGLKRSRVRTEAERKAQMELQGYAALCSDGVKDKYLALAAQYLQGFQRQFGGRGMLYCFRRSRLMPQTHPDGQVFAGCRTDLGSLDNLDIKLLREEVAEFAPAFEAHQDFIEFLRRFARLASQRQDEYISEGLLDEPLIEYAAQLYQPWQLEARTELLKILPQLRHLVGFYDTVVEKLFAQFREAMCAHHLASKALLEEMQVLCATGKALQRRVLEESAAGLYLSSCVLLNSLRILNHYRDLLYVYTLVATKEASVFEEDALQRISELIGERDAFA